MWEPSGSVPADPSRSAPPCDRSRNFSEQTPRPCRQTFGAAVGRITTLDTDPNGDPEKQTDTDLLLPAARVPYGNAMLATPVPAAETGTERPTTAAGPPATQAAERGRSATPRRSTPAHLETDTPDLFPRRSGPPSGPALSGRRFQAARQLGGAAEGGSGGGSHAALGNHPFTCCWGGAGGDMRCQRGG